MTHIAEVESSRSSLVSRTSSRKHFVVFGLGLEGQVLGLEASSPRKLPCPWPRTAQFFETTKFRRKMPETLRKICEDLFFEIAWKAFLKIFFFFFWKHWRLCPWSSALASRIPVLGLDRVYLREVGPEPWDYFCVLVLALASSLVSSTPPLMHSIDALFIHSSFK